MARGTQLIQLVEMLKAEAGHSTRVNVGVDKLPEIKQILRRTQETLYDESDWPFLRVAPYKDLAAGQRYYDFPADLDLERVEQAAVWYSGTPKPIIRGIGFDEYAQYDSENDERADPVLKWDVRWTGSAEQIEVWPIPSSDDQQLQFIGIRPLRALVSDSDVADLDDQLIVLYAAAELLARQGSKDAQAKLGAAQARFARLKGRVKGASEMTTLGTGNSYRTLRGRTIIRVS